MEAFHAARMRIFAFAALLTLGQASRAFASAEPFSPAPTIAYDIEAVFAADSRLAQMDPIPKEPGPVFVDSAAKPNRRVASRRRSRDLDDVDLEARRDRFAKMQSNGFGLMMGGVGAGVGGLVLMMVGISELESSQHTDAYGNQTGEPEGILPFFVGYISLLAVCPTLLTTGIILNRVGNHRREAYERMIQDGGSTRLDIGPNGIKLSYTF